MLNLALQNDFHEFEVRNDASGGDDALKPIFKELNTNQHLFLEYRKSQNTNLPRLRQLRQYAVQYNQKLPSSLKELKLTLAKAYRNQLIDRKHSEDKAYLILAANSEEVQEHLKTLVIERNNYKGLEKVMEARSAALSFNQSLIKNKINERG